MSERASATLAGITFEDVSGVRAFTLIFLGLLTIGCAAAPHGQPQTQPAAAIPNYSEATASALVFDPPISAGDVHPELARGPRAPAAILGYQQSIIESYTTATDDVQTDQGGNFATSESLSVKSGVTYR